MLERFEEWTTSPTDEILMVLLSAVVTYSVILIYTRLVWLKMSGKTYRSRSSAWYIDKREFYPAGRICG